MPQDSSPSVPAVDPAGLRRLAIAVRGVVQGVGFRPFVYNAARAETLSGWVCNETDAVRIEVQGPQAALDRFLQTLRQQTPPQARVDELLVSERPLASDSAGEFSIRASRQQGPPRPAIPTDLATCEDCLREIFDPTQRRYRYPFTNCTNCGPRWSIIEQLPYDRSRTSMRSFAMCDHCRREYSAPTDRRFHAQPIACPHCGPQLQLLSSDGSPLAERDPALRETIKALSEGKIVAIKGLGGFQLLVDATRPAAVAQLRQRKRRPDKPLAVMIGDLAQVRCYCELADGEAALLASSAAPILLLRRRRSLPQPDLALADELAPGNPYLGVMLPYSPLHHLLLAEFPRPVVCTSGNLAEEPMAIRTEDAVQRLGKIADLILTHDRPIVRPLDDSVGRVGPDGLQLFRRARGYAPLPLSLTLSAEKRVGPADRKTLATSPSCEADESQATQKPDAKQMPGVGWKPDAGWESARLDGRSAGVAPLRAPGLAAIRTVLAVGGHLKNAVAINIGRDVVLSPHIGDLDNLLSVEVHQRAIEDLVSFFAVEPQAVACDLHPDYASTRHAELLAHRWGVPLIGVQHHHAHVAACMAEHGLDGPVLGITWDGSGYGTDGTVWGGEILLCAGSRFRRVAHLRTFPLPGGDAAARQPRRSALGLLYEMLGTAAGSIAADWYKPAELKTLLAALERKKLFPRTSSMGRLFDAIAMLCGFAQQVSFEGQAAMALEFAADVDERTAYPLPLVPGEAFSPERPAVGDWQPLVHALLEDRQRGLPISQISAKFHNALADWAVAVALRCRCPRVVLSGGCFQNARLSQRLREQLSAQGFEVYTHRSIPPGDGGLALGQILIAANTREE